MNWFRTPGITEYLLIIAFISFYTFYLIRTIRIARALQTSAGTVWIKFILRSIVFCLILVAILGPSFGDTQKEVKSVGKDIMICVDLSRSMDAFDIQPSRLEKVKFEMKRIVEAFNSDRVGVIIFSSEAFMQCPLTYDQNALNLFIETMSTSLVPNAGTDFGPPLKMAIEKFKNDEAKTRQSSKIIILISDGEDFGEDTKSVASDVEDENIKLFTLGIGTEQGSQIPSQRGYKTDRNGVTVISRLNSSDLKSLAKNTNGSYFEISESRNDVPKLINTINSIEGELRDTRMTDVSANRYFYFLLAAILLFCIDLILPVRTIRI
jgi:Ca-activated chloride channel family protein